MMQLFYNNGEIMTERKEVNIQKFKSNAGFF